jgi:cytochrome c oxidase cbb3-type subunit IV
MDINFFRICTTVLSFLCFIGILIWVFQPKLKNSFNESANYPFLED